MFINRIYVDQKIKYNANMCCQVNRNILFLSFILKKRKETLTNIDVCINLQISKNIIFILNFDIKLYNVFKYFRNICLYNLHK